MPQTTGRQRPLLLVDDIEAGFGSALRKVDPSCRVYGTDNLYVSRQLSLLDGELRDGE